MVRQQNTTEGVSCICDNSHLFLRPFNWKDQKVPGMSKAAAPLQVTQVCFVDVVSPSKDCRASIDCLSHLVTRDHVPLPEL